MSGNRDENPPAPAGIIRRLLGGTGGLVRRLLTIAALIVLAIWGVRAYQATQGPALRPWHTIVPAELDADEIASGNWNAYVAAESRMFEQFQRRVREKMEPGDRTALNRYHDASFVSPAAFGRDWNRSFVLEPAAAPTGVVVLLHGLTDSPYSVHHLAELYRGKGFVAIAPRLPGHGTLPAGLTREGRKEWKAAVQMSLTEAARRAEGRLPVHLVGYSNGGALAVLHVMERIAAGAPPQADRVVLLSPMIEVSSFARYSGLAGLPAMFGRFAKSAWLDLLPEYNPFKYNSFTVRAARESYMVTAELHDAIEAVAAQGRMQRVPPILGFQSVVDDTVGARGVMTLLFDRLAANGSELVLFDINRRRELEPMLSASAAEWTRNLLQAPPRRYTLTVVGAASEADEAAVARSRMPGAGPIQTQALGMDYPRGVYSLSHIALPFPDDDALYGNRPSGKRVLQLGAIAVRGERNTLAVSQDSLNRLSHNPFYDYMAQRIATTAP